MAGGRSWNQEVGRGVIERMEFDYSKLDSGFNRLSKPAKRALINNRIHSAKDLAKWTRQDVARLHGIGPTAFPVLDEALKAAGLQFKPE